MGEKNSEKGYFKNLTQLKKANKENGYYFFSPETMTFFKTKIVTPLILGKYFICKYTYVNGKIKTVTFLIRRAQKDGNIKSLTKKFSTKDEALIYLTKLV